LSVKTGDMKIATFNVNGINGRLPVLLRWLAEARPDVLCLQELKAADDKLSGAGHPEGRLSRHLARPEELERCLCRPGGARLGKGQLVAEAAADAFNPGTLCRSSEPNR
jgi:Endonuclease/Exonuclease/phosphatase family